MIDAAPKFFVCLGAGNHQLPVMKAAKRLGFNIIAVDRNLLAPGMELSDIQIQCDISDHKSIIQIICESMLPGTIEGIGSRSFGEVTKSLTLLSDYFHTPGPGLQDAGIFLNKRKLKKLLHDKGIRIPHSPDWHELQRAAKSIKEWTPYLVRPACGHSKLGLELLESRQDLERFLKQNPVDDDSLLVEKLIKGDEYTVLGLVQNGNYQTISITKKITSPQKPLFIELQHIWPASLSTKLTNQISRIMKQIVQATHVQNAPFVAEFLIQSDDALENIYLVECAPETGGEYLADVLLPRIYPDDDYFLEIVKMNSRIDFMNGSSLFTKKPVNQSILIQYIPQKDGLLKSIDIPNQIYKHEDLIFLKTLKSNLSRTSLDAGNTDRLAVFCLASYTKSVAQLQTEAKKILDAIEINYENT